MGVIYWYSDTQPMGVVHWYSDTQTNGGRSEERRVGKECVP